MNTDNQVTVKCLKAKFQSTYSSHVVSRQSQEQLYDYPPYHLTLQNMGGIGLSSAPQMPSLPYKTTVGDWSLS